MSTYYRGKSDRDALKKIQDNITSWYSFFNFNYQEGFRDKTFLLSSQWDYAELASLQSMKMPILQNNVLYDIVKKTIGQFREMTPSLQVKPKKAVLTSDEPEEDIQLQNKVNIITNMLRAIAYGSDSRVAYQTAFENALVLGYGALRVNYEYEDAENFNTRPVIETVTIPELCFFDPSDINSKTKGDGEFCGIYTMMPKDEFYELYPDAKFPDSIQMAVGPGMYFQWYKEDSVCVADYYYKEYYTKNLILFDNGHIIENRHLESYYESIDESGLFRPKIVKRRKARDYKIVHCKVTGSEILEKVDFPSKILPIVYVDGDSYWMNNRQFTQSFIKHGKDAQRVINETLVSAVHSIKNIRKEQYMAPMEAISAPNGEILPAWLSPEITQGVLPYNASAMGRPEKIPPGEISQSLFAMYNQANEDVKRTVGVYDANLGANTREVSGVAINAKQQFGNLSSVIYRDNILTSMEHVGKCVLSMIEHIYDTERNVTLLTTDGAIRNETINLIDENGQIKNNILSHTYDVAVEAGVSYDTRKEAMLGFLVKALSIAPQNFNLVADLFADLIDVENRALLVERFKTLVPPQILAKEENKPMPPPPPPPPPNPEVILKGEELALKRDQMNQTAIQEEQKLALQESDQQLKERMAEMELMKAIIQAKGDDRDAAQKELRAIAEIYKTRTENQTKGIDLISRVLDTYR